MPLYRAAASRGARSARRAPREPLQAIFTTYKFHYPLTVALLQMCFISPVSYLVARPVLSFEHMRGLAPLAFVNVMNVVCGLIGVQPPWAAAVEAAVAAAAVPEQNQGRDGVSTRWPARGAAAA